MRQLPHSAAVLARARGLTPPQAPNSRPPSPPPPLAPGAVPMLPLSDVPGLSRDILLLKVDTEGFEADVLAGCWALWDAGRVVHHLLLEVKDCASPTVWTYISPLLACAYACAMHFATRRERTAQARPAAPRHAHRRLRKGVHVQRVVRRAAAGAPC